MIVAGCDIGSLTAKALILDNDRILAVRIGKVKSRPEISARDIMEEALKDAGLQMKDIVCCIGTGYGGKQVPFAKDAVSEIACHARGARWLLPTVRTVIDVGGQDCKVMKLDGEGRIVKFATNDKCAAGTGRFMEVMAKVLNVGLDELGDLSSRVKKLLNLSSTCTVWAQAEVIQKINEGERIEDIGDAVNNAMANRVMILANTVGVENDVCMTGGVSKNRGVVKGLERLLDIRVKKLRLDPQAVGALGAAVIAGERRKGGGEK